MQNVMRQTRHGPDTVTIKTMLTAHAMLYTPEASPVAVVLSLGPLLLSVHGIG